MDTRSNERLDEIPTVETPEDVAVLYSWANLHGAKYRDFSASRREYRAQLRHRAAEHARELELRAQADAETAAARASREAERLAGSRESQETEGERQRAQRQVEEAARMAAAERIEAARRAEAAALAEASARREEREIAEANASARRQAAQYADSEVRRRLLAEVEGDAELPGTISDPYTPQARAAAAPEPPEPAATPASIDIRPTRYRTPPEPLVERTAGRERDQVMSSEDDRRYAPEVEQDEQEVLPPVYQQPMADAPRYELPHVEAPAPAPQPRRQGYRPDDASGVREIYRGPGHDAGREPAPIAARPLIPAAPAKQGNGRTPYSGSSSQANAGTGAARSPEPTHRRTMWAGSAPEERPSLAAQRSGPVSATEQANTASLQDPTPRRRKQDMVVGYRTDAPVTSAAEARGPAPATNVPRVAAGLPWQPAPPVSSTPAVKRAAQPAAEALTPAWLNEPRSGEGTATPKPAATQSSVADTLQHSRERVAARWYALKGVFDAPGQERPEPQPVRQKETRTPVLAIFSLAGGVGKTSLVATLGRALSSMGEKVLLTDTTSHGLLPFYFGASELRQGTVRTFSPPSGSTDAPIYLVSYDVDGRRGEEDQDALIEEITESGRGTHRMLLDLSGASHWLLRRMAHLNPTVLVPVAPDMNSIISLQGVDKVLHGMTDADGAPTKVFYVLNQFDASLPLHLDVREVLRRQLGDRLLPFVIRRAPAVSEALAEGMTIVDYSPDAPVAEDYASVATWLRSQAAPATAGFRNVRWSER